MSYRIIALDLDGTLLTPRKTILPESLIALQKAREAGVKVIIVTGRHHVAIHPFYQALALDTPAICCNGTYLYDYHAKRVLKSDPLPNAQAQQVIQLLDEAGIHGLLYVDNAMLWQKRQSGQITSGNLPCRTPTRSLCNAVLIAYRQGWDWRANGHGRIRWILLNPVTVKGNAWLSGWRRKDCK